MRVGCAPHVARCGWCGARVCARTGARACVRVRGRQGPARHHPARVAVCGRGAHSVGMDPTTRRHHAPPCPTHHVPLTRWVWVLTGQYPIDPDDPGLWPVHDPAAAVAAVRAVFGPGATVDPVPTPTPDDGDDDDPRGPWPMWAVTAPADRWPPVNADTVDRIRNDPDQQWECFVRDPVEPLNRRARPPRHHGPGCADTAGPGPRMRPAPLPRGRGRGLYPRHPTGPPHPAHRPVARTGTRPRVGAPSTRRADDSDPLAPPPPPVPSTVEGAAMRRRRIVALLAALLAAAGLAAAAPTADAQPRADRQSHFGRMFGDLPGFTTPTAQDLADLASSQLDPNADSENNQDPEMTSIYTYFGQFIDHDLTQRHVTLADRAGGPHHPPRRPDVQIRPGQRLRRRPHPVPAAVRGRRDAFQGAEPERQRRGGSPPEPGRVRDSGRGPQRRERGDLADPHRLAAGPQPGDRPRAVVRAGAAAHHRPVPDDRAARGAAALRRRRRHRPDPVRATAPVLPAGQRAHPDGPGGVVRRRLPLRTLDGPPRLRVDESDRQDPGVLRDRAGPARRASPPGRTADRLGQLRARADPLRQPDPGVPRQPEPQDRHPDLVVAVRAPDPRRGGQRIQRVGLPEHGPGGVLRHALGAGRRRRDGRPGDRPRRSEPGRPVR